MVTTIGVMKGYTKSSDYGPRLSSTKGHLLMLKRELGGGFLLATTGPPYL